MTALVCESHSLTQEPQVWLNQIERYSYLSDIVATEGYSDDSRNELSHFDRTINSISALLTSPFAP